VFTFEMDKEFVRKINSLGEKTGEISEKCLKAGGEIILKAVRRNLKAVVGKSGRSTGELDNSLGITPVKKDKNGVYNLKIGFNEPRRKQSAIKVKRSYYTQTNAMIASVLEYGKSRRGNQPPRPFMKPALEQNENSARDVMQRVFDEEVGKL
jgi:HK97 gp10 family phage protein